MGNNDTPADAFQPPKAPDETGQNAGGDHKDGANDNAKEITASEPGPHEAGVSKKNPSAAKHSMQNFFSKAALKGHAKALFNKNSLISFGAGAAAGYAIKALAFTLFSSAIPAIIAAGIGIGIFSTLIHRYRDIQTYNKTHTDCPLKFFSKDCYKLSKSGHDWKHYAKKGAVSAAFAIAGGLLAGWLHDIAGAPDAPPPTPDTPPEAGNGGIAEPSVPPQTDPVAPPAGAPDPAPAPDPVPEPPADGADPVVTPIAPVAPAELYTVIKGDNLWDIVKDHYDLTSNADIQRYADAIAVANHLAEGTEANTINIGDTLSLPAAETIANHTTLALDWNALDAETATRRAALSLTP